MSDRVIKASVFVATAHKVLDGRAPKGLSVPTAHPEGLPFDDLGVTLDAMADAVDLRTSEGTQVGYIEWHPPNGPMRHTIYDEYRAGGQGGD